MIYLDSAATSLLKPKSVEKAMTRALRTMASPGRGGYEPAMLAAQTVFSCRCAAAELFNVPEPEQVVFTFNATHALNIAIGSLVKRGDRVVTSGYEHNSVTRALRNAGAITDAARSPLFDSDAAISAFKEKIPGAAAAVCTHVSNVFGFILPVYEIAELCRKNNVPLIIDASQSAGALKVDFSSLGAEFIAMPGHKGLLGPQGTGLLLCGEDGVPLLCGCTGSESKNQDMPDFLPDRLEAGTHNVTGIAGLLAGIEYVSEQTPEKLGRREAELREAAVEELSGTGGLELFSGPDQAGVLSLRHRSKDCETLCSLLSENGVAVRGGLHCAPQAHETAGTADTGTLRMSFSPFTEVRDVKKACRLLKNIAEA